MRAMMSVMKLTNLKLTNLTSASVRMNAIPTKILCVGLFLAALAYGKFKNNEKLMIYDFCNDPCTNGGESFHGYLKIEFNNSRTQNRATLVSSNENAKLSLRSLRRS
jgi:hypothetical protein